MALLRPVTDDEIATYQRDGVVHLRKIIDQHWVGELRAAITDIMENPISTAASLTNLGLMSNDPDQVKGFVAGSDWTSDNDYAALTARTNPALSGQVLIDESVSDTAAERGQFFHAGNAWMHNQTVRDLCLHSPMPEVAATLMQSSHAYLYGDQVLVKGPLTREKTAWHQDYGYGHYEGLQICAVRMPCDSETRDTGTVGYVRGSHRPSVVYKVNYFVSNAASPDDDGVLVPEIDGHEDEFDIVYFTPEPGDLVIHDIATLHGGGGNRSETQTRRAITVRYAGDDAVYKKRKMAPPQALEPTLEPGQPIGDDPVSFPRAWPPKARA
ncbi:MAG: phytanoyl-CoA dioxygenase family protein [Alphaproteobacteria bacterium]